MSSSLKPYADLKVKVREYTDPDGKTKGVYTKIGTLFSSPHHSHMFMSLESIPVGVKDWDGAVSVFKRDDWDDQQTNEEVEF